MIRNIARLLVAALVFVAGYSALFMLLYNSLGLGTVGYLFAAQVTALFALVISGVILVKYACDFILYTVAVSANKNGTLEHVSKEEKDLLSSLRGMKK